VLREECEAKHAFSISPNPPQQSHLKRIFFSSFHHYPSRPAHCDRRVSRYTAQDTSVKCLHRATQVPCLSTIAPLVCNPMSEQRKRARLAKLSSTSATLSICFLCIRLYVVIDTIAHAVPLYIESLDVLLHCSLGFDPRPTIFIVASSRFKI